jgi:hypothetical protein
LEINGVRRTKTGPTLFIPARRLQTKKVANPKEMSWVRGYGKMFSVLSKIMMVEKDR